MKKSIRGIHKNKKRLSSRQGKRVYHELAKAIGTTMFNLGDMQAASELILDKK